MVLKRLGTEMMDARDTVSHLSGSRANVLFLLIVFSALGCEPSFTALVSGVVTVDGEPAKVGAISFIPEDNIGTPVGGVIEDGNYSVEVPFGSKKVEVRVSKVVGKKRLYDTPDSPVKEIMTEALPPKYNSATELRLNVTPGGHQQDYHLETK